MPPRIKWVVHDTPHPARSTADDNAENVNALSAVDHPIPQAEPIARAIEYRPDDRPSQRFQVVDHTGARPVQLAKCRCLSDAEIKARAPKAG